MNQWAKPLLFASLALCFFSSVHAAEKKPSPSPTPDPYPVEFDLEEGTALQNHGKLRNGKIDYYFRSFSRYIGSRHYEHVIRLSWTHPTEEDCCEVELSGNASDSDEAKYSFQNGVLRLRTLFVNDDSGLHDKYGPGYYCWKLAKEGDKFEEQGWCSAPAKPKAKWESKSKVKPR